MLCDASRSSAGGRASDLGTWQGSPADGLLPRAEQPVQGVLKVHKQPSSSLQERPSTCYVLRSSEQTGNEAFHRHLWCRTPLLVVCCLMLTNLMHMR